MVFKRLLLLLIILSPQYILAQIDIFERMDSSFNARKRVLDENFNDYVKQMDDDFVSYLAKDWEQFMSTDTEVKEFDDKSNFVNVSFSAPSSYPSYPSVKGAKYEERKMSFFEKGMVLNVDVNMRISMLSISERQVSRAWKRLSETGFSSIIEWCDRARNDLSLNDWGVYLLVSHLADHIFEKHRVNEKQVFMAFILTHAGYDIKMGRTDRTMGKDARLYLLIPFKTKIGGRRIKINDKSYYILSDTEDKALNSIYSDTDIIYSYRKNFKLAKSDLDLAMKNVPQLGSLTLEKKIISKSMYFREVNVAWRNSLTEYYDSYPTTVLPVYSNTPLSMETKTSLQKSLEPVLNKVGRDEFVGHLLYWFVQAFKYRLDDVERPFFSEQTVRSQYSDCEDRAILFARIVKEIAGLDAVLVVYKGKNGGISHVATGICFDKKVSGDSKVYNGREYTICDPSCMKGTIGITLDGYCNSEYEIIDLIN